MAHDLFMGDTMEINTGNEFTQEELEIAADLLKLEKSEPIQCKSKLGQLAAELEAIAKSAGVEI